MKAADAALPLLAQALRQTLAAVTGGADLPAITLPAAPAPRAPAFLARSTRLALHATPGRARSEVADTQLYSRCLALFRQRVQADAQHDDLGCAAALFVMANLCALGRQGGDIDTVQALTQQMQNALQRLPGWSDTPLDARQLLFEQLALLSVLITQAAEAAAGQGPLARANVRKAARGYLRQWLAVDPELLDLSPQGLVVREGAWTGRTAKAQAA